METAEKIVKEFQKSRLNASIRTAMRAWKRWSFEMEPQKTNIMNKRKEILLEIERIKQEKKLKIELYEKEKKLKIEKEERKRIKKQEKKLQQLKQKILERTMYWSNERTKQKEMISIMQSFCCHEFIRQIKEQQITLQEKIMNAKKQEKIDMEEKIIEVEKIKAQKRKEEANRLASFSHRVSSRWKENGAHYPVRTWRDHIESRTTITTTTNGDNVEETSKTTYVNVGLFDVTFNDGSSRQNVSRHEIRFPNMHSSEDVLYCENWTRATKEVIQNRRRVKLKSLPPSSSLENKFKDHQSMNNDFLSILHKQPIIQPRSPSQQYTLAPYDNDCQNFGELKEDALAMLTSSINDQESKTKKKNPKKKNHSSSSVEKIEIGEDHYFSQLVQVLSKEVIDDVPDVTIEKLKSNGRAMRKIWLACETAYARLYPLKCAPKVALAG